MVLSTILTRRPVFGCRTHGGGGMLPGTGNRDGGAGAGGVEARGLTVQYTQTSYSSLDVVFLRQIRPKFAKANFHIVF